MLIGRSREQGKPAIDPAATIILSEYDKVQQVRAEFATYLDTNWRPWAEQEKLRRKTIRLYSQLFTLKQQLEGGLSKRSSICSGSRPGDLELRWHLCGLSRYRTAG